MKRIPKPAKRVPVKLKPSTLRQQLEIANQRITVLETMLAKVRYVILEV